MAEPSSAVACEPARYSDVIVTNNELEKLLLEWGMFYLRDRFTDAGYDRISDLQSITELELHQMFPSYHDQCHKVRLRRRIVEWRIENGYKVEVDLLSRTKTSTTNNVSNWLENNNRTLIPSTSTSSSMPPPSMEEPNFNMKMFLETDKGRHIWKSYMSTNPPTLGSIERKLLVDSIIEYYNRLNVPICQDDFEKIATEIAGTFISERKEWYYHNLDNKRPTGKLYNRYKTELSNFSRIERGSLAKRLKSETASTSTASENDPPTSYPGFTNETDYEKDKEWLQRMNGPWYVVEMKFKNTFRGRRLELLNGMNIQAFYEEWIILRNPDGYKLIDIEFQMLFPDKNDCMKQKWTCFVAKILPIMLGKIKDKQFLDQLTEAYKSPSDDWQFLLILKGLHYLLKPSTRLIRISDKKVWKVSIRDSIASFFLELNGLSDVDGEIRKKHDLCNAYGIKIQPFIVIFGHQQEDKKFAVCYREIFYRFNHILECISIAFKMHFALNLDYTTECYKVWLFIQNFFFDIRTAYENSDPEVSSLIWDLNS